VGANLFKPFTDLISYFTERGYELKVKLNIELHGASSIDVARNACITGAEVGDIAGVVIKDNFISVPRDDMEVSETERMARLTDRFLEDLRTATADQPLVVFIDAAEKLSDDTQKWVWGELFDAVRSARLRNVKFVVCTEEQPNLEADWCMFVEETTLAPLGLDDVANYLAKCGVDATKCDVLAPWVWANTKGKASEIVKQMEMYRQMMKRQAQNNEGCD
jgi:hypothetical protein